MSDNLPLGQILRAAREQKGLTLSEVAEGTRIKVQVLEAMEHNDFRPMPAAVYAKGFIKMYAEFIGVDPAPLIAQYVAHHAPPSRRPSLQTNSATPGPRRAVEGEVVSRAFDWPRIRRDLAEALLRPVELAMLALDRLRVPTPRRRTAHRSATATRVLSGRFPIWQFTALAAAALVILVLLFSGFSRYLKRAPRAAGAAPLTTRLAEEPPPPYFSGVAP
jgi:transcriptional regulator with XRE-family HTH domain